MSQPEVEKNEAIDSESSDEMTEELDFLTQIRRDFLVRDFLFNSDGIVSLYLHNKAFKKTVDSGKYVFVDGKIVLKSKLCLKLHNGKLMTDIEDEDLHKYCLKLSRRFKSSTRGRVPAYRSRSGRRFCAMRYRPSYKVTYKLEQASKVSSLKDVSKDNLIYIIGGGQEPPNDFGKALIYYMSELEVTVEQLATATGLSEKTIQRMRTAPEIRPTLESVVAVCIGLHLDAYASDTMLHLAGYSLTNKTNDRVYRLFLNFAYKENVEDCNNLLIRLGMEPLTNLHD